MSPFLSTISTAVSAALNDRWTTLAAGVIVESASGSSYAFGVYSSALQSGLNLTLSEINSCASAGNVGFYTNFFAGLAFDAFGPLATGLVGAAMSLGGYSLVAAYAAHQLPPSVAGLAFSTFLWGHGAGYTDTAALATSVRNFPRNRGLIVGLLRAFFGLSAAILSLFYASIFRPDVPAFLRFLSVVIPATAATGVLVMRLVPAGPAVDAPPMTAAETRRVVGVGYGLAAALGCYLLAVSVAQDAGALQPTPWLTLALVPLLLGQVLLAAPWRACSRAAARGGLGSAVGDDDETAGLLLLSPLNRGASSSSVQQQQQQQQGKLASYDDDDEDGGGSSIAVGDDASPTDAAGRSHSPAAGPGPGSPMKKDGPRPRAGLPPGGSLTDNVLSVDFALIFTVFLTVAGSGGE